MTRNLEKLQQHQTKPDNTTRSPHDIKLNIANHKNHTKSPKITRNLKKSQEIATKIDKITQHYAKSSYYRRKSYEIIPNMKQSRKITKYRSKSREIPRNRNKITQNNTLHEILTISK